MSTLDVEDDADKNPVTSESTSSPWHLCSSLLWTSCCEHDRYNHELMNETVSVTTDTKNFIAMNEKESATGCILGTKKKYKLRSQARWHPWI